MKRKPLIFINVLLAIFVLVALFNINPDINLIGRELFKSDNNIEDEYEVAQVKLFAITLEAKDEYLSNIKTTPLTCNINVERVTRIIYMDEETNLGQKSVVYKKPVGKLMEPTKKGYIFEMWTNENNDTINEETILETTTDYKVYANWNIIVSNLTVNPNGGTWQESTGEQSFSLDYNEEKEIADPTRTGYTFQNWEVTGADSTITEKVFKMGTEDATIKAIWKANGYVVTIDPNGGTYDNSTSKKELSIDYDSSIKLDNPTRKGYTFVGWSISNGTLNGNEFIMNYSGDVTITANWKVNSYKYIVYHNQQSVDGTAYNKVANDTVTDNADYGTTVTPKVNTYTGFLSPTTKDLVIDVDEDPPIKNIVNYDYARQKFNLTINPNTGTWNNQTTNQTVSLYYQQTYNVANPTKTGYNFAGWSKDDPNSKITDQIFTMNLRNTMITANWEAKKYTLTYSVNGGNPLPTSSKTITFDSAYGTLSEPTRTGYDFAGWYTSASGGTKVSASTVHTVDNNVTIYAHWTNTAPTAPNVTTTYKNSGLTENGQIKNGSESATLVAKSTDSQDGTPTITVKCTSGKICNSLTITKTNTTTGQSTFTVKSTSIGVGVLEVTATDKAGATNVTRSVFVVYSEDNGMLVDAKYTNTTFDSGWLEYLEGCYISDFSFKVKFDSGHNNSSSTDEDDMIVYGMTESGKQVVLYTWSGNMSSDLHVSNLTTFNKQTEKIRQIRFYTYSPHDDCAKDATISYSVNYKFDISLLESNYKPVE